jgi:hypothetical protein
LQYTVLVTVVIGSALVPTIIAQTFFKPAVEEEVERESAPVMQQQASVAYEDR